jgi:hypothetical protein
MGSLSDPAYNEQKLPAKTAGLWCLIGFPVCVMELNVQLLSQFVGVYMIQQSACAKICAMLIHNRVAEPANCFQITL